MFFYNLLLFKISVWVTQTTKKYCTPMYYDLNTCLASNLVGREAGSQEKWIADMCCSCKRNLLSKQTQKISVFWCTQYIGPWANSLKECREQILDGQNNPLNRLIMIFFFPFAHFMLILQHNYCFHDNNNDQRGEDDDDDDEEEEEERMGGFNADDDDHQGDGE